MLSTTDLAKAGAHAAVNVMERRALPSLRAKHLMTRDVIVTWPEEPLEAALDKLMVFHIHRLVVVKSEAEQDLPVGILSVTDLAAQAATH